MASLAAAGGADQRLHAAMGLVQLYQFCVLRPHRPLGDAEPVADLLVAMTFREQLEDLRLAGGQRRQRAVAGPRLIEGGAAADHGLDCRRDGVGRHRLGDEAARAAGPRPHPHRRIVAP